MQDNPGGPPVAGPFDGLSPDRILDAVEAAYGLSLDGTIQGYNSYINRVYGLADDDGGRWIVKCYRPGRWTRAAIMEEHAFVAELAEAELPVVPPLANIDGETLSVITADSSSETVDQVPQASIHCALYPLKGGRTFDPVDGEDWYRIGALAGRLHAVGATGPSRERLWLDPLGTSRIQLEELLEARLMDRDSAVELKDICTQALEHSAARFPRSGAIRLHGDLHRGNILERPGEGLMLVDFDDMAMGPPVQDLWMLLPGRAEESRRELEELLEGYETFHPFDRSSLGLIEDLRFMRMLHFLHWCARQRNDARFAHSFGDWGTKGFWITEIEDLREQTSRL